MTSIFKLSKSARLGSFIQIIKETRTKAYNVILFRRIERTTLKFLQYDRDEGMMKAETKKNFLTTTTATQQQQLKRWITE